MKRLEGKVAVVTGGNSGIGLATAQRFLAEGAKVAISGRNEKTLAEAARTLGKDVVAIQADTAKLAEVEKFLAAVQKKVGKIDVLFINAGVAKFAPLTETPETLFDEQFDINIKGAYFTIQKAVPYLNDGASIILNTSVAASTGTAGTSAYSATKAALRSLARTAAAELVERNIRVNAVAPGPIVTPIFGRTGLPQQHRRLGQRSSRQSAHEALRATRRSRWSRSVPRLARFVLHDRRRNQRGRRDWAALKFLVANRRARRFHAPRFYFCGADGFGESATSTSRNHVRAASPGA